MPQPSKLAAVSRPKDLLFCQEETARRLIRHEVLKHPARQIVHVLAIQSRRSTWLSHRRTGKQVVIAMAYAAADGALGGALTSIIYNKGRPALSKGKSLQVA